MKNFIRNISGKTKEEVLNFCFQHRLINEAPLCDFCSHSGMTMSLKKSKDSSDGYNWRCMNYSCVKYQSTKSLRCGSWFDGQKVKLPSLLKFLYFYAQGGYQNHIAENSELSIRTTRRLIDKLCVAITAHYQESTFRMGGPGIVVQADETMLNYKVKSHRGRGPREQTWALCLVDTSSSPATGYAEIVPNRRKDTLLQVITRVVREGTEIHTDEWRGYQDVGMNDYIHRRITHKYNFVDPFTGFHTQHVESFNNKLKVEIKKAKGVKSSKREAFLKVFMFFEHNRSDVLSALFNLIKL